MIRNELYPMIFKRKSFHLFRNCGREQISDKELDEIKNAWESFERLTPETKTAIRIIPAAKVAFKRDAEYCVLIYSEEKPDWLQNAGYLGQQLDLWLASKNIGSLWFGIGKPDEPVFEGLSYVIMFAIRKVPDETYFRKDMYAAKRKPLEEIWDGETFGAAEVARFTPSACNSQPWKVENKDGKLTVYRYTKKTRIGIMSPKNAQYFNRIDIGIYLCILELCLAHEEKVFTRTLFPDDIGAEAELTKVAEYIYK